MSFKEMLQNRNCLAHGFTLLCSFSRRTLLIIKIIHLGAEILGIRGYTASVEDVPDYELRAKLQEIRSSKTDAEFEKLANELPGSDR